MLTSEKQKALNWQIKTKEGMYFQPESLAIVYQWIFENRVSVDDSIFSARVNDWVPLVKMPELEGCFWQLLTNDNIVYGPLSPGELKQLYLNNQVSSDTKVSIFGRGKWVTINQVSVLNNWMTQLDVTAIDYVGLVEKLQREFEPIGIGQKEERIGKKLQIIEKENKEKLRQIRELESNKKKIEEEFSNTRKELEGVLSTKDELSSKLKLAQDEIKILKLELQEKKVVTEELNKDIAQAEVNRTLRDDDVNQLRSNILSLQEELGKTKDENTQLKQSLPDAVRDLEGTIEELNDNKKKLEKDINILKDAIIEKEKLLDESGDSIKELSQKNEELNKKIISLEDSIIEKDRLLEESTKGQAAYTKELQSTLEDKENKISNLSNFISDKEREINSCRDEIAKLEEGIISRNKVIEDNNAQIENLDNILRVKEGELSKLKDDFSAKDREISGYRESIAQLQSELVEKDREIAGAEDLKTYIEELKGEIDRYKQRVEELNNILDEKNIIIERAESEKNILKAQLEELEQKTEETLKAENDRFTEEIKIREDTINELNNNLNKLEDTLRVETDGFKGEIKIREDAVRELNTTLNKLKEEYSLKVSEWESALAAQKMQFQDELSEKTRQWEETLSNEKEKWNRIQQDLEGNLAQREAQIEDYKMEIERLRDAVISKDTEWQKRFKRVKEESERLYKELEEQRDAIQTELTQKINETIADRDALNSRLTELEKSFGEVTENRDNLQKELLDRDKFIESIKNEAKRRDESFSRQLVDMDQRLLEANKKIGDSQDKINELTNDLQKELETQEGLKKDISVLNEDLDNTKKLTNELREEKESISSELKSNEGRFAEIQLNLEKQIEEIKRNLEHAEEENRSLQRQFYLEKQKLTREYNETIGKMEKLQKRSQLEREIQDRAKMKDELERLYNLLRENFTGLQRGAEEIQSSLNTLTNDIDNRRLSLKYLNETGKRTDKKGQSPKADQAEESDTSS